MPPGSNGNARLVMMTGLAPMKPMASHKRRMKRDRANRDQSKNCCDGKEARSLWASLPKMETGRTAGREGTAPTEGWCSARDGSGLAAGGGTAGTTAVDYDRVDVGEALGHLEPHL